MKKKCLYLALAALAVLATIATVFIVRRNQVPPQLQIPYNAQPQTAISTRIEPGFIYNVCIIDIYESIIEGEQVIIAYGEQESGWLFLVFSIDSHTKIVGEKQTLEVGSIICLQYSGVTESYPPTYENVSDIVIVGTVTGKTLAAYKANYDEANQHMIDYLASP